MWNNLLIITLLSVGGILTQTSNKSDCICVIHYLCKNGTIIKDGRTIVNERAGFPKCEQQDYLCCESEDVITERKIDPTPSVCGVRNPRGVGVKILNDEKDFNMAEFGEFPWMIRVLYGNGTYRCGGSLIHPSVVLTAAHCVLRNDTTYIVQAGAWDITNTRWTRGRHQEVKVAAVKIHEDYGYVGNYFNDIALLYLESPVVRDLHINTVCLPSANITVTGRCFVHGWGKDKLKNGVYASILKKVEVNMVPNDQCQINLRNTRVGPYFELHRSFVCAGGEEGQDACEGDGGSPLVCKIREDEERYQQIGIVAWGIDCGLPNVPGVYANVPVLREWIDKQMKDNNFEIK